MDLSRMKTILEELNTQAGPPHILIANTIFGKVFSYMEKQIKVALFPMNDEEYKIASAELEAANKGHFKMRTAFIETFAGTG